MEVGVLRGKPCNKHRAEAGLPAITPHSLRRTWATLATLAGRPPKWIAAQIGHTSEVLTFRIYEQVATRRYVDEQAIWEVMRFADEPAERPSLRQLTRAIGPTNGPTDQKSLLDELADVETEN
jgi:hypothetical protein